MGAVSHKGHTLYVYGAAATLLIACHFATKTADSGPGNVGTSTSSFPVPVKRAFYANTALKSRGPNRPILRLSNREGFFLICVRPKSNRAKYITKIGSDFDPNKKSSIFNII